MALAVTGAVTRAATAGTGGNGSTPSFHANFGSACYEIPNKIIASRNTGARRPALAIALPF